MTPFELEQRGWTQFKKGVWIHPKLSGSYFIAEAIRTQKRIDNNEVFIRVCSCGYRFLGRNQAETMCQFCARKGHNSKGAKLKRLVVEIDESLFEHLERLSSQLKKTRTDLVREVLQLGLAALEGGTG